MPAGLRRVLASIIWCLLVLALVLGGYLSIAMMCATWIANPVLAGTVAGAVVLLVFAGIRKLRPSWVSFASAVREERAVRLFWPWTVLIAVLMFLTGQLAAAWVYEHLGSAGFDRHAQALKSSGVVLSVLAALLIAPIVEETLFRGVLYPVLRKRVGAWPAMVVSALLFALLHGNSVQAVAVIPLGLLLALVAERTHRVWPCVLVHMSNNLAAMVFPQLGLQSMAVPLCIGLFGGASALAFVVLTRQVISSTGLASRLDGQPEAH